MATYAEIGIHLDDARRTTERLEEIVARGVGPGLADVGAFGGMFRLGAAGEFADPVLVASTDGIGTKVKIAAALGRYGASAWTSSITASTISRSRGRDRSFPRLPGPAPCRSGSGYRHRRGCRGRVRRGRLLAAGRRDGRDAGRLPARRARSGRVRGRCDGPRHDRRQRRAGRG